MADQPRVEELVARDAVASIQNLPLSRIKRLPSQGKRTGDWRVRLGVSRVADIEVTMHTDGAARSFRRQVRSKPGPEWHDDRLSHIWTVWVSDPDPEANYRRPVKQLIDALIPVLVEAEATGAPPSS